MSINTKSFAFANALMILSVFFVAGVWAWLSNLYEADVISKGTDNTLTILLPILLGILVLIYARKFK